MLPPLSIIMFCLVRYLSSCVRSQMMYTSPIYCQRDTLSISIDTLIQQAKPRHPARDVTNASGSENVEEEERVPDPKMLKKKNVGSSDDCSYVF